MKRIQQKQKQKQKNSTKSIKDIINEMKAKLRMMNYTKTDEH